MSVPPGWLIADSVSFPDFKLLPEDRTRLGHLSSSLEIQEWILTRVNEQQALIRSFRSLHNASVPINCQLPQDVLSEIFLHLPIVPLDGQSTQRPAFQFRAFKFLHVCRLWRQIILGTPSFWTAMLSQALVNVNYHDEENRFAFILGKTGVLPLSVTVRGGLKGGDLIEMLIPYAHRLSYVQVGCTDQDMHRLLSAGLPRLRELYYDAEDAKDDRLRAPYIDSTKLPQLCTLRVPAAFFRATTTFSSLQCLDLMESRDRKSTRLNSSHSGESRMPSSA